MVNQANSQIQFLQVVSVVLVMATLIGLISAYVLYRDVQNLQIEVAEAKSQADRFRGEIASRQQDIETLKDVMGYPMSEVGTPNDVDATTIVGKVQSDINQYVGGSFISKPTLRSALIELHSRWRDVTKERNTLKANLEKLSSVTNP